MSTPYLDFYFDYLSPYAWFAWRRIPDFCRENDVKLRIHPVVFGKLLDHWGQRGPAEIEPKRQWLAKYCYRYASQHGFEHRGPKFHPFNPLAALRLSLREVSGERQAEVVSAIFDAGWAQGKDPGDPDVLLEVLDSIGVDGSALMARIAEPPVKDLLKQETEDAINRGVFGVPTMIVDDELFWGNDQFDHMAQYVGGNDPIDSEKIAETLGRKRAIDRKTVAEQIIR